VRSLVVSNATSPRPAAERLLQSVRTLTAAASSGAGSVDLAERVAAEVVELLGADGCAVFRFDGDEAVMVSGAAAPGFSIFTRGTRFALEESPVSGTIRRTGKPARSADYAARSGDGPRRVGALGYRTVVGAPIFVRGELWGTVTAGSGREERLPPGSELDLELFAELCAMAVASGEDLALLESRTAEQAALLRISRVVLEGAEADVVLSAVAREGAQLLGLTDGAVLRYREDGSVEAAAEWSAGSRAAEDDSRGEGGRRDDVAALVRDRRAVVSVGDPDSTAAGDSRLALGLPVGWGAPIEIEGRLWGALVVAGPAGLPIAADAGRRLARFVELSGHGVARLEARAALVEQVVETEQFAALVELSDDFIAIADLEGNCVYLNRGGRRLVGLDSLEEARSHAIPEFLTPEGVAASLEVEQPAVMTTGSWEGESTLRHFKTGEEIPVSINSFLVVHPITGQPLALATVQRDLRELKVAEESLRARAEEVEQLAAARRFLLVEALRAEERMRRQIGDSLHDDVLQELYAARQDLAETERDSQALDRARVAVDAASRQLRDAVGDLHPAVAWTHDLETRLRAILERGGERAGFEWTLEFAVDGPSGADDLVLALVRELVQNVVKHAGANSVTVAVSAEGGNLAVSVADDGRGMSPGRPVEALRAGHIGIASARERVDALGGRFDLDSEPGAGTRVRVLVPRSGLGELSGPGG
jgi:PAS domain S-box-containing protein